MDTLSTNLISDHFRSSELILLLLPTNYWSDVHEDYHRDPTNGALKVLDDSRFVEYFLTAKNIKYANIWTASVLRGYHSNIQLIVKYLDSIKYEFKRMKADPKYYLTPDPQHDCYNILYNISDYHDLLKRQENYHKIYMKAGYKNIEDQIMDALALAIQNDDSIFVDYLLTNYKLIISNYRDNYLLGFVILSIFSSKYLMDKYKYILDQKIINSMSSSMIADNMMNVKVYIPAEQLILMVEKFKIVTWNDIVTNYVDHQVTQYYYLERSPDPRIRPDVYNTFKNHAKLQYLEIAVNKMYQNDENINISIEFDGPSF